MVISSHRTAAADVLLASNARVIPVVRHVVNADQVLRVISPNDGAMVERTNGTLPWELLGSVPVWVGHLSCLIGGPAQAHPRPGTSAPSTTA
ncbi:hypothetical protein GCM10010330_80260 [Streptomyces tendae]|uniref:hypothetical protein n=1 Tax=Streptomyces tendae TaxID=1932 RepID=UPI00199412F3|nr:hypothetical protein [Streptomyces tendae]GHB14498.1 hypothetical protein GCM10010330_80260 [Streptomyces tendae]